MLFCRTALYGVELELAGTVALVRLHRRAEDVIGSGHSLPEIDHRFERSVQLVHPEARLVAGDIDADERLFAALDGNKGLVIERRAV